MNQIQEIERVVRAAVCEESLRSRPEKLAFTIDEFCERRCVSRSTFYEMMRDGTAPRHYRVGTRTYVSRDAASDWQRGREQATTESASADQLRRKRVVT